MNYDIIFFKRLVCDFKVKRELALNVYQTFAFDLLHVEPKPSGKGKGWGKRQKDMQPTESTFQEHWIAQVLCSTGLFLENQPYFTIKLGTF